MSFPKKSSKVATIRAPSKQIQKRSKQNMYWEASLGEKRKDSPLPLLAHCERREFCLDGVLSKNAPYQQKNIFHIASSHKISWIFFLLGQLSCGTLFYEAPNFQPSAINCVSFSPKGILGTRNFTFWRGKSLLWLKNGTTAQLSKQKKKSWYFMTTC